MEIKVTGDPIFEAEINLKNMKKIIMKEYDLEKAVKSSINVKMIKFPKDQLKKVLNFVYLGINWGSIIGLQKHIKKDKMQVRMYPVEHKDWTRYKPDKIDMTNQTFKFKEIKGDERDSMIFQDFVEDVSWNVKNYIDNSQFQYGSSDFNILVDMIQQ